MNIDGLPRGTHATVLSGRDIVTGADLARIVVWADRPYDTCPLCGQPVAREVEGCPVVLDVGACQGGWLCEWSKQHGCGEWLRVNWSEADENDVLAVAERLAAELAAEVAEQRAAIRESLTKDLRAALARLAEPLDGESEEDRADSVRTGSEIEPGVYRETDGSWLAWAYDGDDTITVTQEEAAR